MQPASSMKKAAVVPSRTWLLVLVVIASGGCGGVVEGVSTAPARALLEMAPVAADAVAEQDLPGCRGLSLPGTVQLARYPQATDLLVAMVDGRALCVDEPTVVLRSLGVEAQEEGSGLPGDDPVPVRGAGAPTQGDDDPVPINGRGVANGDDDPVPINGSRGGGVENGDDDPVPINGKHMTQVGSQQVAAAESTEDDGSLPPSHPVNPRLLSATPAR